MNVDETEILPGLKLVDGKPWKIVAENMGVLRAIVGDELLGAFARCFAAADRLMTIMDCILLNRKTHADSVRRNRNQNSLALFAAGLVSELREGVTALKTVGLESHLTQHGIERLEKLDRLFAFEHESTIKVLRNQVAFHIGKQETALRGIARRTDEGGPIVVASGDGKANVEGQRDIGWEILISGMDVRPHGVAKDTPNSNVPLNDAEFRGALNESHDAGDAIVAHLDELFMDVLHKAGGNVEALDPLVG